MSPDCQIPELKFTWYLADKHTANSLLHWYACNCGMASGHARQERVLAVSQVGTTLVVLWGDSGKEGDYSMEELAAFGSKVCRSI